MATKFTIQEKLDMVTACRTSGLTDHQWCEQNNIVHSTFYNWINQLRKTGVMIPPRSSQTPEIPILKQDIVRVDVVRSDELLTSPQEKTPINPNVGAVEIVLGNAVVKISNDISKELLVNLMTCLGGRL